MFTFDDAGGLIAERVIPAKTEVLDEIRSWGARGKQTGGVEIGVERAAWIGPLVNWVQSVPGVTDAHRGGYLSWHAFGQQVLRITRTRDGLKLLAGVQYTKPKVGQPVPPPALILAGPLTEEQVETVRTIVQNAMDHRASIDDVRQEENRLQHLLMQRFRHDGELFGSTAMHREDPCGVPARARPRSTSSVSTPTARRRPPSSRKVPVKARR